MGSALLRTLCDVPLVVCVCGGRVLKEPVVTLVYVLLDACVDTYNELFATSVVGKERYDQREVR